MNWSPRWDFRRTSSFLHTKIEELKATKIILFYQKMYQTATAIVTFTRKRSRAWHCGLRKCRRPEEEMSHLWKQMSCSTGRQMRDLRCCSWRSRCRTCTNWCRTRMSTCCTWACPQDVLACPQAVLVNRSLSGQCFCDFFKDTIQPEFQILYGTV